MKNAVIRMTTSMTTAPAMIPFIAPLLNPLFGCVLTEGIFGIAVSVSLPTTSDVLTGSAGAILVGENVVVIACVVVKRPLSGSLLISVWVRVTVG